MALNFIGQIVFFRSNEALSSNLKDSTNADMCVSVVLNGI